MATKIVTGYQAAKDDRTSTKRLIQIALSKGGWRKQLRALVLLQARATREVFDAALALCASRNPKHRMLGAKILGEFGSPRKFKRESGAALRKLLRDENINVVMAAIFAFGHNINRRCEPAILPFRHHRNKHIRHGVAFALQGATAPDSVRALLDLMEDPNVLARDWATTSIGATTELDGPAIRAALLRRANDPDEITRAEALHGLARRKDVRAAKHLSREIRSRQEKEHLFCQAAETLLGLPEGTSREQLLKKLAALAI